MNENTKMIPSPLSRNPPRKLGAGDNLTLHFPTIANRQTIAM